MKEKTIKQVINLTINHYICLQKEEMFLEYDEQHNIIVINWHVYMDRFINMKKVFQIAHFMRRYIDIPIYSAYGEIKLKKN